MDDFRSDVEKAANAAYHQLYNDDEYFCFDHSRDAYEMGFVEGATSYGVHLSPTAAAELLQVLGAASWQEDFASEYPALAAAVESFKKEGS